MTEMTNPDFDAAIAILRENDRGAYTVPTKGLYPFQWNWDSCLTALGLAALDEDRADQWIRSGGARAQVGQLQAAPHPAFVGGCAGGDHRKGRKGA